MALRTFTDERGMTWSVWAVRPGGIALGSRDRRRPQPPSPRDPPVGGSAIDQYERRLRVRPEFSEGWLAFHAGDGARRRLAPVPHDWERLSDEELELCCRAARPMPTQRE